MKGFKSLLLADLKLYLREPAATFFTLIFPALILVIGGYSFGQEKALTTDGGVVMRVVDVMVPSTLAWVIASQGLMGVYPVLTSMRESKVLKYYRTHPIKSVNILLSQYLVGFIMLVFSMALLWITGAILFHIRSDAHMGMFILILGIAYTAFFSLGFALASVTPSPRMAQAIGSVIFFPLLFLSGSFGPRDKLPPVLKLISDLSPLSHANDLLTAMWVTKAKPLSDVMHGVMPFFGVKIGNLALFYGITPIHSIAYLLGLGTVTALIALVAFRWSEEQPVPAAQRPSGPPPPKDAVIFAQGLRKLYGNVAAVDNLDLHVRKGEIFGLLGPNGAGKTTTVEILEGLRPPTEGTTAVLGLNPITDHSELVMRTGVQLQEATLPSRLKVREIMNLFASFYPRVIEPDTLLKRLDLAKQADTFFGKLSGGQKQRLFAALAMLNDPEVIFLDEITTGLDPAARRKIWSFLRELRKAGKTILLTTHYLEEAQALCDRVLFLHEGKVILKGEPMELINNLKARFRLELEVEGELPDGFWKSIPGVARGELSSGLLTLYLKDESALERVLSTLRQQNIPFRNLRLQPVSLEDVFLLLVESEKGQAN